jgi:methyl-accepting chemotaxis protein
LDSKKLIKHQKTSQNGKSKSAPKGTAAAEQKAKLEAIDKVQAVIEFAMDGTILRANANFLQAMGYQLAELAGQHHRIFVEPEYARSAAYAAFWQRLNDGKHESAEYKCIGKNGREVWISASYNPILDARGKAFKVVKYATDVTQQKLQNADYSGQIAAIGKAQAVIEFAMDGTIRFANDNFLNAMGYRLDEVQGKHHRMFVESDYARSDAYRQFWQRLNEGSYESAEYKCVGKNGREVWIQASYNPIMDLNGKPFKIVKYATDVTQRKLQNADFAGQIAAIGKAQAVIEFAMDGTILQANDNFLNAMGYQADEVKGKHHRMFVESEYARSDAYRQFWQRLNEGSYEAAEYKRIGKNGREVWIQASYNPIIDLNGKPFKVVKYATVVTQQKQVYMQLSAAIEALSRGDLTVTMTGDFVGDHAVLRDKMNMTVGSLATLISQINQAVSTISSGANDIAEGNANLNTRTQEQSSSLEETASSLEELTATVKQNANNANQANQLATSASDAAEKGGQVVGAAVAAMSAITDASKKVADIIGVIEQIAFQTNMLALNAAVEAARAGDQGRGFAVVAAEVRTLAQRSASAAKEIKALIQDSQEKVEQGAKLVNRSGETLHEIVGSVKKVSNIIGEIDTASDQQASGIDQINAAVAQMDKNTQENAAMVEQASAAAESMTEQARNMAELVRFFQVEGSEPEAAPERRPSSKKHASASGSRAQQHEKRTNAALIGARQPAPPQLESDWKSF